MTSTSRPSSGAKDRDDCVPGDQLMLECDYDTASRGQPSFGGLSTRDEMCLRICALLFRTELADYNGLFLPFTATRALWD